MQDLGILAPTLDPSQKTALTNALNNRVALIQGPPGTGKTFIGVNLCELILKHSSEKILCVCYTNHALDQFLEALLQKGITDVVRIGSRSKSKQLEQYNLRELANKSRAQTLNPAESRRMGVVYREIESVEERLQQLADMLATTAGPLQFGSDGRVYSAAAGAASSNKAVSPAAAAADKANQAWQQRNKELQEQQEKASQARQAAVAAKRQGKKPRLLDQDQQQQEQEEKPSFDEWVDAVGPYLEAEQPEVLEQLTVPADMKWVSSNYLWTWWLRGFMNKGSVDRFLQAKEQQATAAASGGWQQAKKGKLPPLPNAKPSDAVTAAAAALAAGTQPDLEDSGVLGVLFENIWSLPGNLRHYLAQYWRGQLRTHWSEEMDGLMQQAYRLQQELKALHDSSYEAVLQNARVIGCTTTGAALQKDLLSRTAPG